MASYREKRGLIATLVLSGYSILEVVIDGVPTYFLAKRFEKSTTGSIQSAPFFEIKGKDITDFIDNYTMNPTAEVLVNNLRLIDDRDPDISFQFSDNHVWRYFQKD